MARLQQPITLEPGQFTSLEGLLSQVSIRGGTQTAARFRREFLQANGLNSPIATLDPTKPVTIPGNFDIGGIEELQIQMPADSYVEIPASAFNPEASLDTIDGRTLPSTDIAYKMTNIALGVDRENYDAIYSRPFGEYPQGAMVRVARTTLEGDAIDRSRLEAELKKPVAPEILAQLSPEMKTPGERQVHFAVASASGQDGFTSMETGTVRQAMERAGAIMGVTRGRNADQAAGVFIAPEDRGTFEQAIADLQESSATPRYIKQQATAALQHIETTTASVQSGARGEIALAYLNGGEDAGKQARLAAEQAAEAKEAADKEAARLAAERLEIENPYVTMQASNGTEVGLRRSDAQARTDLKPTPTPENLIAFYGTADRVPQEYAAYMAPATTETIVAETLPDYAIRYSVTPGYGGQRQELVGSAADILRTQEIIANAGSDPSAPKDLVIAEADRAKFADAAREIAEKEKEPAKQNAILAFIGNLRPVSIAQAALPTEVRDTAPAVPPASAASLTTGVDVAAQTVEAQKVAAGIDHAEAADKPVPSALETTAAARDAAHELREGRYAQIDTDRTATAQAVSAARVAEEARSKAEQGLKDAGLSKIEAFKAIGVVQDNQDPYFLKGMNSPKLQAALAYAQSSDENREYISQNILGDKSKLTPEMLTNLQKRIKATESLKTADMDSAQAESYANGLAAAQNPNKAFTEMKAKAEADKVAAEQLAAAGAPPAASEPSVAAAPKPLLATDLPVEAAPAQKQIVLKNGQWISRIEKDVPGFAERFAKENPDVDPSKVAAGKAYNITQADAEALEKFGDKYTIQDKAAPAPAIKPEEAAVTQYTLEVAKGESPHKIAEKLGIAPDKRAAFVKRMDELSKDFELTPDGQDYVNSLDYNTKTKKGESVTFELTDEQKAKLGDIKTRLTAQTADAAPTAAPVTPASATGIGRSDDGITVGT